MKGRELHRLWALGRKVGLVLAFSAVVIVLLLWLAGAFGTKIHPEEVVVAERSAAGVTTASARVVTMPRHEAAVGTIRPVAETSLGSRLLASVAWIDVQAGQRVEAGDVVVRLDDADLRQRLDQVSASVQVAQAQLDQAAVEFDRTREASEQGAASAIELERVTNAHKAAAARFEQAQQAQAEARTVLGYATIRSPIDGMVVEKFVDAGDTVSPGQALLLLYDPAQMQLVADVRESLADWIEVGQEIGVEVDALNLVCSGTVGEIVPRAAAGSRSFEVKVVGPCPEGVYSGMFGRILIPLDDEEVLVVPAQSVYRVGQLEMVDVVAQGESGSVLRRRLVRLGRVYGEDVEILSGVRAGEVVALHDAIQGGRGGDGGGG